MKRRYGVVGLAALLAVAQAVIVHAERGTVRFVGAVVAPTCAGPDGGDVSDDANTPWRRCAATKPGPEADRGARYRLSQWRPSADQRGQLRIFSLLPRGFDATVVDDDAVLTRTYR